MEKLSPSGKGQLSTPVSMQERRSHRCWVPLSSPSPPGILDVPPHLHPSPALPILGPVSCCHPVQQDSAQVPVSLVATLRLESKQRILHGVRDTGQAGAVLGSTPPAMPPGKCSTGSHTEPANGESTAQQLWKPMAQSFSRSTGSLLSTRDTAFPRCPGCPAALQQALKGFVSLQLSAPNPGAVSKAYAQQAVSTLCPPHLPPMLGAQRHKRHI